MNTLAHRYLSIVHPFIFSLTAIIAQAERSTWWAEEGGGETYKEDGFFFLNLCESDRAYEDL